MPGRFTDGTSILIQVMAWCRQAPSHYLNQYRPRSPTSYGVIRPQWINSDLQLELKSISVVTHLELWRCKCLHFRQVPLLVVFLENHEVQLRLVDNHPIRSDIYEQRVASWVPLGQGHLWGKFVNIAKDWKDIDWLKHDCSVSSTLAMERL